MLINKKHNNIRQREQAFKIWINHYLQRVNIKIQSLNELKDSLKLIQLVQLLSNKTIDPGPISRHLSDVEIREENMKILFNFLSCEGLDLVNINSKDIVNGKRSDTLELVWVILKHYTTRDIFVHSDENKLFLEWWRDVMNCRDLAMLDDLISSGQAFLAAFQRYCPDLVQNLELGIENPAKMVKELFLLAKNIGGIPIMLDATDVINGTVDTRSMMAYLLTFCKNLSLLKRPIPLSRPVHVCMICQLQTQSPEGLYDHLLKHVDDSNNDYKRMDSVIASQYQLKIVECLACKSHFRRELDMHVHLNQVHHYEMKCMFRFCSSVFQLADDLKKHLSKHIIKFKCPVCYKEYKTKKTRDDHYITHGMRHMYFDEQELVKDELDFDINCSMDETLNPTKKSFNLFSKKRLFEETFEDEIWKSKLNIDESKNKSFNLRKKSVNLFSKKRLFEETFEDEIWKSKLNIDESKDKSLNLRKKSVNLFSKKRLFDETFEDEDWKGKLNIDESKDKTLNLTKKSVNLFSKKRLFEETFEDEIWKSKLNIDENKNKSLNPRKKAVNFFPKKGLFEETFEDEDWTKKLNIDESKFDYLHGTKELLMEKTNGDPENFRNHSMDKTLKNFNDESNEKKENHVSFNPPSPSDDIKAKYLHGTKEKPVEQEPEYCATNKKQSLKNLASKWLSNLGSFF